MKMHLAGKTDQAKADLARLAIIKKQREEVAKKKEEEKKGDVLGKHYRTHKNPFFYRILETIQCHCGLSVL